MKTPPFKMIVETEMERYRYETWQSKEPETIKWINSFDSFATFFDIGANVGIYSLYCNHKHPDSLVYAFEPSLMNCRRLMQNIELNSFTNIVPFNIAISNIDNINIFHDDKKDIGHSGGQINQGGEVEDCVLMPVLSLDTIVKIWDYPTYIKIDIDGQELSVIEGGLKAINDAECKGVLVEINRDAEKIENIFHGLGYTSDNIFNRHPNHSRYRRAKEGIKCENVIFCRK